MKSLVYHPTSGAHGETERRYLACHDPFWPRVDLTLLRQRLALETATSETQLVLAAQSAVAIAMCEFAKWRRVLRMRGYHCLADLGGHAQGRALSICYLRLVEAGTRRALASHVKEIPASGPLGHRGNRHA